MNDIDLTKILKNCPKGTKLYSTIHGEVEFVSIEEVFTYSIVVRLSDNTEERFTAKGKISVYYDGECILFPSREQQDWSKFTAPWYKKEKLVEPKFHVGQYVTDGYVGGQITSIKDNYHCYKILDFMGGTNTTIPFTLQDNYHLWTINDANDGDVLATSKGVFIYNNTSILQAYCYYSNERNMFIIEDRGHHCPWNMQVTPATKEQRDALMKAMNDAGYEWDAEKKELKKLVVFGCKAPNRFDPKTLKEFDKVLVRDEYKECWCCDFFSHMRRDPQATYKCATTKSYFRCCIPYNNETKHLVGTKDEAPEFYRYWEE